VTGGAVPGEVAAPRDGSHDGSQATGRAGFTGGRSWIPIVAFLTTVGVQLALMITAPPNVGLIILVLVIRSFLFEPFRIPSDSMMPTLYDGDFIFVSKYSYGLRLPVTNTLVYATGTPARGDVIVFRLPPNPKINYIKRLIGLPGDKIRVDENNLLYVNGKLMPQTPGPPYAGPKQDLPNYTNVPTAFEQLDAKRHQIMLAIGSVKTGEWEVPPGHYFFMGDNRNNSKDSRWLDEPDAPGFVPEQNLVGKAVRIWLNLDTRDGPLWKRITKKIE